MVDFKVMPEVLVVGQARLILDGIFPSVFR